MTTVEHVPLGHLLRRAPRYGINAAAVPLKPGLPTYIRITDIDDAGRFAPSPKVGVTHPASANYVLGSGEIVFARTGASVGKSYLYDPVDGQLVYAGFLINIAPDPKQLNPKFLALFAQSKEYWDWIARTSVRSGQPGVNGREYATLPVPLPDITTQDAIAEAIGDVEQFIRSLERLIAKKQAIKQGMMQQLLTGRIRLLGFTDAWGQSTVGEEFDVQLGKRLDAAVNRGALKTCINNRGVRWGRILLNEAIEAPLTHADIQTLKLTPGDVLICEGGEIGRSAVWRGELPEAYFLNTLHRLRSKGNFNPHLLVAFFERWVDTGELSAVVGKATLAHLTKENLVRVPVPMPGHDEQEGMAIILKEADDELDALRGRLAKARAIKTGMMQQLLTGRTRLPAVVAS